MRRLLLFLALLPRLASGEAYYSVGQIEQAKAEAQARHLPIAWLATNTGSLQGNNFQPGNGADLTDMALKALAGRAVIILENGLTEKDSEPPVIAGPLHTRDDPTVPAPHTYFSPKIIFTDPGMTTYFDKTFYTEMHASREAAIDSALNRIHGDPDHQALLQKSAVAASSAPAAASPAVPPASIPPASDASDYFFYILAGAVIFLGLLTALFMRNRSRADG